MSRARRIGFELLPQSADEHPEILDLISLCRAPYLAQQMPMGQHLSGVGDEMAKQLELFGRELDLLASAADVPPDQIDRQIAGYKDRQLALDLETVT